MKTTFWSIKGLYNRPISKLVCLTFFLLLMTQLSAQEKQSKWFGMLNINEGYRINEESEWSTPGLSYELFFRPSESFGLQSKSGFLFWKDEDINSYFTMIGAHYKLSQLGSFDLLLYGNAGITFNIGNDWSQFFAMAETGLKLMPKKHKNFNASFTWSHNMLFYNSPAISYLSVSIGYVF